MRNQELIQNAIVSFGTVVVKEVIDLTKACIDLSQLRESFDHLRMKKHSQCLEMLFGQAK